ncbi:hypothetical protein QTP88_028681 [Uroleucon formosanum]
MATVRKKKEAIILAIDIGKNSSRRDLDGKTHFEKAIFCASMILKRKILTESEDHLALILFGSSHTINHLSSEGCCYGNIEIVAGLDLPTWDLFNCVNGLSPTNVTHSDWISTFVLAADLLKDKIKNKNFTGLQIVMFSNLSTDISFKNIDIISNCLKVEKIKLTIVGKDCEVISLHPGSDLFLNTTKATAVKFDLILPKISYYKQKEVIKKSWNVPLSFGETFYIKVFAHKKIDITTKSSDWLFSKDYDKQDLAIAEKKPFEGKGEHNLEVGNESPMDNFNCGDEIIPVIDFNTEECTYKITDKKCLQVLGFAKTTNTQSSFLIGGGSYIFRPHKTDIIAFNAIFDYIVERKEVILVRKIDLYINLLNIGALFPQKERNEKFFVYVNLPNYVENDHTYKLPPLDSFKLTDAMDVDINGSKFVMPEIKYDVELQSLYDCMVQQIYTLKSIMKNSEPTLKHFMKSFSFKQEVLKNSPAKNNDTLQFGYDKELDISNKSMNPPKSFIKNAKPSCSKFQNTFSLKQEVHENSPDEDDDTIQFGYDEELDILNKSMNSSKSFIKNAKPSFSKFQSTFSLKQEVHENSPNEDNDTIQFGYDEELDILNKSMNSSKSFIKNAKPSFSKFQNTFSLKQEVHENSPDEDNETIQFGYDEELDILNKSMNPSKSFIKNAKPSFSKFQSTFSIKQEVHKISPNEDNDTIQFGYDEELDILNKSMNPSKSFIKNAKPSFSKFQSTFSLKQEVHENSPDEDNETIQFGYDEELDILNKSMNPPKSFIKNAKESFNEFQNTFSIKQEVPENSPDEDDDTIQFGYDEELDILNKSMNPPKSFIKNAKQSFNEFQNTFSIKQEVHKISPDEDNDTIQFGYDEELDILNKSMNPPKSFIKNAKQSFNEFQNTFSIKQEVPENSPDEDDDTIQFGYDEELDILNKSMNPPKSFIKNAKPSFSKFQNTFSIKQEVHENSPDEDNDTIQFGYDEELDILNKSMNPPKSFIKNAKQSFNEFQNTLSIKQEVRKISPDEDDDTIQFGYDEELDILNKSMNPPKSFIKNAKQSFNEFQNTLSIKQEVPENSPDEDDDTIQFGYDEELDILNKSMNPPKSVIKNAKESFNEFQNTFLIKQEVPENSPDEDDDTIQFGYDEELDILNKSMNPPKSVIKNAKESFNEFQNTFSIKQEVPENSPDEDDDTIQFGYDEELDILNKSMNPPKSVIKNAKESFNEFQNTFSLKQEVHENSPDEDNDTIQFGYDEELDILNKSMNPPKSFIKNAKQSFNEFQNTLSIKQEVPENSPAKNNDTIQFGYDKELDISNKSMNPPKSFIKNAKPSCSKFQNTFSLKQEVHENSSIEDNSTTKVGRDKELEVAKQCVITPMKNSLDDLNNLLKNGFYSAIVCTKMQHVTLNLIELGTSLEDLMKPIATLKALREYYINNNNAKSYNNFMYLVKDRVRISGKKDIWSKFINSGIGLITNEEIEESDISQESSEEFMKLSGDFDIDFIIGDNNPVSFFIIQ